MLYLPSRPDQHKYPQKIKIPNREYAPGSGSHHREQARPRADIKHMDPLHAHTLLESDCAPDRCSVGAVPLCVEDLRYTQKSKFYLVARPALNLMQVDQVCGEM